MSAALSFVPGAVRSTIDPSKQGVVDRQDHRKGADADRDPSEVLAGEQVEALFRGEVTERQFGHRAGRVPVRDLARLEANVPIAQPGRSPLSERLPSKGRAPER